MKKNAMLKIAAILMVAVLLTTCAISSTFAKYTTTDTKIATARVAKWGVGVTTDITGIFSDSYGPSEDGHDVAATIETAEDGSLIYNGVVAPGTNNSLTFTSALTGTPEVSVVVSYALTIEYENFDDYDPILWSLDGEDWFSATDINGELTAAGTVIAAGSDLSTAVEDEYTLQWKWLYEAEEDADIADIDAADTALGNAAAEGEAMPTVKVTLTTVITQSGEAGAPVASN